VGALAARRAASGAVTLIGGSCELGCAPCASPEAGAWLCAMTGWAVSRTGHEAMAIALAAPRKPRADLLGEILPTESIAPSERNDLDAVVSFIPKHPESISPIRSCASFATSDAA